MKEIKLQEKVYKKEFDVSKLGYDCKQVDTFLDEVNEAIHKLERDLEVYKERNQKLENENESLSIKINELNKDILSLKTISNSNLSNQSFSNIDLVNRLTNLENMVQKIIDKDKS